MKQLTFQTLEIHQIRLAMKTKMCKKYPGCGSKNTPAFAIIVVGTASSVPLKFAYQLIILRPSLEYKSPNTVKKKINLDANNRGRKNHPPECFNAICSGRTISSVS